MEQGTAGKKTKMGNELILPENYKQTYDKIVKMIETAKYKVFATKALHGEVFPIGWFYILKYRDGRLNGIGASCYNNDNKNTLRDAGE